MQEQLPRCAPAALPKDSWPGSAWSVRRQLSMGEERDVGSVARARRAGVVPRER